MRTLLLMLTTTLVGCTTVGVTSLHYSGTVVGHRGSCHLDVYAGEDAVKVPFESLCLIDAKAAHTGADAIDAARSAACGCGADALIVASIGQEGDGFWVGRTGTATLKAVRYTAAPPK